MKSIRLPSGSTYYAHEYNALRSDAVAASWLHVHQQLGALALGTNPSNNQTVTLDINGTNVVFTAVTSIGSTAGNFLIGASAAATVANLWNGLINPTTTTSTFIALSSANAQLVQYIGFGLPASGTTITPFSLNTSTYSPLTSFTASTTVTSGSWTAQTMQLYVQPGTYYIGTTRVLFLGGSTPTFTAPSSHPRIDLITADSSGTIATVTGTESATPSAPSYPANKLVLAEIWHVVGETALYDNDNQQSSQGFVYNDVRNVIAPPYISSTSQVATGLFILDPGSEAQGDTLYYNGSTWTRLPAGTSGYALQTQGASANPQWALMAQTAQVKDVSGANITPNADNTFHTIATYSSIPGLSANQTLWIRMYWSNADGHTSGTVQIQLTLNGTALNLANYSKTGSASNGYADLFIVVPTPASSQTYYGILQNSIGGFTTTSGTLSANLSSAFTILVQGLQNTTGSPAMNGAFTVVGFELNVIN